ncbi:hypothetical protein ABG768_000190 [Culter alburnus]|uniref:DNA/RNA non-specific endonuclease/pyrophosphatase/phosphodiesterase domain-containing protein n=1 Tax=Culter alburnus TaxID=194366 RepID=A0AAW2B596_CULAL
MTLLLHVLMLILLSGGSAEVVQDFEQECGQFFINAGPNILSDVCVDINLRGVHQALSEDYEKSGYDRGHLAPVYQAESQKCAEATFTLTKAAPQDRCFNREELSQKCSQYSVFIVTGVVPGTQTLNNRVNVPSHFWTAYCCLDQNNKCQFSDGFIGENMNIPPNRM